MISEYKRSVGENERHQPGRFYVGWLIDHQAEPNC
jgi:hypothetical protein